MTISAKNDENSKQIMEDLSACRWTTYLVPATPHKQRMLITLSLEKAAFAFSVQLNVVQEPGVGSSSIGSIINAQPAFHFNPDLTVSSPVPSGHFDTACHQYSVLFTSRWLGVLAFEGSSHCLGWPVLMLYRKRPQASVN